MLVQVKSSLGAHLFYMPHGLTVDHEGNIWVTDVGLHQVSQTKRVSVVLKHLAKSLLLSVSSGFFKVFLLLTPPRSDDFHRV
jgi:peptidylamidoglycolate lyase